MAPDLFFMKPDVFGTLANQARFDIIFSLMDGEKCASTLCEELELEQSLVSHSLKKLESVGFVSVRPDGKFRYYRLNREFADPFIAAINPGRVPGNQGNLLRIILAQAPITIAVLDKRGTFLFIFGDILRKYGAVEEDFIGKSFHDFYKGRQNVIEQISRALGGETVRWVSETDEHAFDTMSMPYRDANGEIAGVLNVSYELPNRASYE